MKDTNKNVSFKHDPEQALKNYQEQGYHIEEDVFSPELCDLLISESKSLASAKNNTFRPQMMPHRENPIYTKALSHPNLLKIMNILVGGQAMGLQTEFFYCKPGTRGFSLHQDNFFVQAEYGVFASAWAALSDVYPEKGGLIVYPGSHKEGLLPTRKLSMDTCTSQDPNANNEEAVVPPQYKKITPSVKKGSVLFIHGHVVHGSNPNQTDEWRYVLLSTYIKKGENFRSGKYAQREAIEL